MTDKETLKQERDAHAETAKQLAAAIAELARLRRLCKTHGLVT